MIKEAATELYKPSYTTREIYELGGPHPDTTRRFIKDRRLRAFRAGTRWEVVNDNRFQNFLRAFGVFLLSRVIDPEAERVAGRRAEAHAAYVAASPNVTSRLPSLINAMQP